MFKTKYLSISLIFYKYINIYVIENLAMSILTIAFCVYRLKSK
jgi:hypothetical protein